MKLKEAEAESYIIKGEEFSLPNKELAKFIKDTITKGNSFRFKAKGFSMCPFIRDGDIITVSPLSNSKIGFGKIVAIVSPNTGRSVVHRVVGKNGNCYVSKGDNTFKPDGLISREVILGYVTQIERNGKKSYIGLGPERILAAKLNRLLFFPFLFFIWRFMHPGMRTFKVE